MLGCLVHPAKRCEVLFPSAQGLIPVGMSFCATKASTPNRVARSTARNSVCRVPPASWLPGLGTCQNRGTHKLRISFWFSQAPALKKREEAHTHTLTHSQLKQRISCCCLHQLSKQGALGNALLTKRLRLFQQEHRNLPRSVAETIKLSRVPVVYFPQISASQ